MCYDLLYKKEIFTHKDNPDYFDAEILANHPDPVHKWCKMLHIQGIDIEFWYLSCLSETSKVFKHKYGHRLRRIHGFNLRKYFSKYFSCDMSFDLSNELKREKITHILVLPYLMNGNLLIDMFDILVNYCNRNNIKIFPIYGGGSIDKYGLIKRMVKSMYLKKTDGLFCQSESEINIMVNKYNFPKTKMHYFKNPLDLENFYPVPKAECAKFLNLDINNRYILYIGRFAKPKGVYHLINIFPNLIEKEPQLRLLVIGWGPQEIELRRLVQKLNCKDVIKIIGFVQNDELKYYYGIADILLLPSYSEGTPNVLMEAIACNTVCIATNIGGIPDLLDDGVGLIVPPKDEKALYDAIVKVLRNGFKINQKKRKELLDEIDLVRKGKELREILLKT